MSRARIGALAALLLALDVTPAAAQFGALGRRIKERVEKAVDDHGSSADSSVRAAAGIRTPRFDASVLELTPDVLDRAIKADVAERAHAERRAAVQARIDAASHPATHPATRPATSTPRAKEPAEVFSECAQKYLGTDSETIRRKCGDVRDMLAKQRAMEVARRAAEQARADSLRPDSSVNIPADSVGAMAAGFTRRQYGIVKERIGAYLASAASAGRGAAVNPCVDNTPSAYTFTDAEMATLSARRDELAARFTVPHHMRAGRKGPGCPAS